MNRMLATALVLLPFATLSLLPNQAGAEGVGGSHQGGQFGIAQQAASSASKNSVSNPNLWYRGVWIGTYENVGSQGQVQLYISPNGWVYGSLESKDGENFAQISGYEHGDQFHLVFTPPPGAINQFGGSTPYEVNATVKRDSNENRFVVTGMTKTGHLQSYTFGRLSQVDDHELRRGLP